MGEMACAGDVDDGGDGGCANVEARSSPSGMAVADDSLASPLSEDSAVDGLLSPMTLMSLERADDYGLRRRSRSTDLYFDFDLMGSTRLAKARPR